MGLARAQTGDVAGGAALAASAYERLRAKLGDNAEPACSHAKARGDQSAAVQHAAAASR